MDGAGDRRAARDPGGRVPPGWPAGVPGPEDPRFVDRAVGWLLDVCPPEYRGHRVLLAHPPVLAWLAERHVAAQLEATQRALQQARAELAATGTAPGTVEAVLEVLHAEGARLRAARRAAGLLAGALQGERWVPRL